MNKILKGGGQVDEKRQYSCSSQMVSFLAVVISIANCANAMSAGRALTMELMTTDLAKHGK